MPRASRLLSCLAVAAAAYLAVLQVRYFFPPNIPRFRVETIFMWFLAVGILAVWLRAETGGDQGREGAATGSSAGGQGEAFARGHYWALAAACAVVVFVLYGAALSVGFLSDDFVLAEWAAEREWIHLAETGFVRPIVPMTWALLSVVPLRFDVTLHAANMLLHALNAVLIVGIAGRLSLRRDEALAAGLLFATFPALSEAVVWTSGMQDVLLTTLVLASVTATLALGVAEELRSVLAIVAVVSAVVALGVKETAVVIPVLAGAVVWASPRSVTRVQWLTLVAMSIVAGVYAVYRVSAGVPADFGQGVGRYFAKQLIVDPFATLGEPWSTAWMRLHPTIAVARGGAILVLIAAAFWCWRRTDAACRRALVSAGWVLISVLPVFSFFHVSATLEGSRYLYLPAAGFSMLLAALIAELARRTTRDFTSPLVGALVLVLAMSGVPAIRGEVARWTEAGRLRDAIVDSYVEVMSSARCRSVVAEGLADNIDGAYVLRNGFSQAIARRASLENAGGREEYTCRISWTDHLVVRQEQ